MYIKLSVQYTSSSICTYFESVRVLKSAKSSLFTAEKDVYAKENMVQQYQSYIIKAVSKLYHP